ncbi:MAG: endopeptidase La [Phycisphaerales bacterium]|nr:endopeptidase La [Phycisphaerales bacterium]
MTTPDPDASKVNATPTSNNAAPSAGRSPGGDPPLPERLPVLPVRDMVVFPGTVVPLTVGREKSRRLIDAVLAGNKLLVTCTQRRPDIEDPNLNDVYRIGTAATVLKLLRMPDGTNSLLVHGLVRVGLVEWVSSDPYWQAVINPHEDDTPEKSLELDALAFTARQTALQVIELSPNVPEEARVVLDNIEKPGALADYLSANLSLGLAQKQELLETFDVADRLRKVTATLNNQLEVLQLSRKIQSQVREQMDQSQREYYLQQQLKAIQKELGEGDSRASELEDLRRKVDEAGMPEHVRHEAERELGRLQRLSASSPETGVIRDYLEWLCQMPWERETADNLDLNRASEVLDTDHYGLQKIKRRILEYLAVRKLKPSGKGPILCFVGPPGVGKTSLGQSIARALGREFIRISLGGVRDEADIRGHRRTYIGSIPGRIVQEIRKAGTRNPVFMLDELDKLGSDFRGDPAAALLEVLDPQQNHAFTDHYLGVPFDLSKVLFIATANQMEPVPAPLRDRMEVIELGGYTTAEKLEIARRYLVPRQLSENGLASRQLTLTDDALKFIIESHTRESGVRNLERTIGTVCRGVAAKVARDEKVRRTVRVADLEEYLGVARFDPETELADGLVGIVAGLAYTPVGGQVIFVEAARMPGSGNFTLTGQIGSVMRESAQAALSLVRARASDWGLESFNLRETDIHIHVPAGGIPKDGPSAGVAMLAALVSLLSGYPADARVAMTGEITLRGQVLPIGGVKEKVLAAHRAGARAVILPQRNEPDLVDVPTDVRKEMQFIFARRVEDVLAAAIPDLKQKRPPRKPVSPPGGKSPARTGKKPRQSLAPSKPKNGGGGRRANGDRRSTTRSAAAARTR